MNYRDFVLSKISVNHLLDLELAAALGIAGEAGEIADAIKKRRFQDHQDPPGFLLEELGDLFFYFTLMLEAQGYTLDDVITQNQLKLDTRYPNGFDAKRSMNRG